LSGCIKILKFYLATKDVDKKSILVDFVSKLNSKNLSTLILDNLKLENTKADVPKTYQKNPDLYLIHKTQEEYYLNHLLFIYLQVDDNID
jgi:hypothetical protein